LFAYRTLVSVIGFRYKENQISDMALAAETSFTDLIIGGHTHSYLKEPVITLNKIRNQVIVNQASWGGMVLGKIDYVFERS